jgi:hypothetical protein
VASRTDESSERRIIAKAFKQFFAAGRCYESVLSFLSGFASDQPSSSSSSSSFMDPQPAKQAGIG